MSPRRSTIGIPRTQWISGPSAPETVDRLLVLRPFDLRSPLTTIPAKDPTQQPERRGRR
ncbi:hypothetical protein ASPFODRAFT_45145 [Aspergillus luchuensis CBS 106.47]|uniref:Uncharacterized protein n=3 Tax=Aspergillus subgen. Circumdati TaxID=2720871 RepID=A0A317UXU2_ASPEC|nr:uncharacterized protein BO83DRAFT_380696 [Aspergillus eucalypticola CBS 122712]OJZ87483.1 hypothetical protein ASPFODRAFT_45145 [Aspergillus luchuensis CBS 106.47]PWY66864.1 hypothetical protein BO83DRAFT_380696 [Aspergillus eucalypticola CBS 122712]GAT25887.1 similar to An02g10230 [Aspergillus luchuensis]